MNRERMKELGKARLTRQNQRTGQRTGAQVLRVLLADGDDEALQVAEEDQSVVENTMVETTVVENTTPSVNGVDKEPEATVVENTVVENTGNKDNINKNSLSPDLIVDLFYTGLGQEKISKEKRERAIKCIEELKQDGFFIDDIAFAVQWTLNHSKEKPYDFSILKHTMGQALAAQEKDRQAEERRQEKAKLMAEKEAVEKEEAEKTEKVNAYKESLSPEERKRLRSKAEAEILETGDYKREFITDALISTTENKILRQEGVL